MNDPRIGVIKDDGSKQWPETTVDGQPYTRPINVAHLDKTHFAVFSTNGITEAQRNELLSLIQPQDTAPEAAEKVATKKGKSE